MSETVSFPRASETDETAQSGSALRSFFFAAGLLAILCLLFAPLFSDRLSTDAPRVRNGAVSFASWTTWSRPAPLIGDWRLVWRAPAGPKGPRAGEALLVKTPGTWTGVRTADGGSLPALGSASFQLTIQGLKPGRYVLFVPIISHASRVWLDGELVSEAGQVGDTPQTTRYLWRAHEIPFRANGSDVHLAIDEAAFHHNSNGLESPPIIGPAGVMDIWLTLESAKNFLYCATILIMAVYAGVAYVFRRDDYPSMYFSLTCLFFLAPALILGHDNLLTSVLPDMAFPLMLGIEYVTGVLAMMSLLAYARALFPAETPELIFKLFQGVYGAFVALYVCLCLNGDTLLASTSFKYTMVLTMAAFLYVFYVVFRAALRRRESADIFLLGIATFGFSVFGSILVQTDMIPEDKVFGVEFFSMGLFVFAFSQVIILAQRWSVAIVSAEAMATDLRRLVDVSASITTEIHLEQLLKKIVEATSRFLQADRSSLFLHDTPTGQLRSMVAEGVDSEQIRIGSAEGIAGHSFSHGEVVIVDDAYSDPRFNRDVDELTGYVTKTMLTMPIVTRDGRRLGVMQALNRKGQRGFDASDIERMRAFTAQAAVAIDNATLFSEIRSEEHTSELQSL